MRSSVRARVLLAISAIGLAGTVTWAAPGDLNPRGKPKAMAAGQPLSYFIWEEEGTWHVRTTTAKHKHHFHGTIQTVGGKITSVEPAVKGKNGRGKDWWTLSTGKYKLALDLQTDLGLEGLNFTVSPKTKEIEFALKIDGKDQPKHIHLGRFGDHPGNASFTVAVQK